MMERGRFKTPREKVASIMLRRTPLLIALSLIFLLPGCAAKPMTVRFPLNPGREWSYSGAYSSLQAAKSIHVKAYDHGLKVAGTEDMGAEKFFICQFTIAGQIIGKILLIPEGGDLYQPSAKGKELVMKTVLATGDTWQFTFNGEKVTMRVEGQEEKQVPAGKYSTARIGFTASNGNAGKLWLADGVGIVAFEYDSKSEWKATRLSLGLTSMKTGE